jgi:hypothetical protein
MNSSSEITSGGSRANKTGNNLENFVESALQRFGYAESASSKNELFVARGGMEGKQYGKQVPCGESIYGSSRRCDFLIINPELFPDGLIVECKWQESSGSVDEKFPFTVLNVGKVGVPCVILIDGGGYKEAAFQWLKEQVDPTKSLIGVYTMMEFQKQLNIGFLGE